MKMTWAYIAGFTDGEGCIGMRQAGENSFYFPISIAQAGSSGKKVLTEIQNFLESEGITSKVYERRATLGPLSKLTQYSLYLGKRDSVQKFIKGILPFSRTKKLKAQDALRMSVLFPPLPKGGFLSWESRRRAQ